MCCCISSTECFFFCACLISVRRQQWKILKIILVLSVIDSISQGDDDLYDFCFFFFSFRSVLLLLPYHHIFMEQRLMIRYIFLPYF